ncbi:unnamed protein product [Pneumocystis jirovecii]|uniref:Checkpoint protein RAD24-like helical bundle domain-containing protein n=1 Tax=Pneumocystis jirovecii TaxID=42068 RepID=L0P780_PNEJI|nr:unnamed protein product [Pneumocystis jirovecii]
MPLKRRKIHKSPDNASKNISKVLKHPKNSKKHEIIPVSTLPLFQSKNKYLEYDSIIIETESEDDKESIRLHKNIHGKCQNMMVTFHATKKSKTEKTDKQNDEILWSEKYSPLTVDDLAVSKKKISEVRYCLQRVLKHNSQKKLIILTGPAGSGKTSTINVLSKEMGFEILEWQNPMSLLPENTDYQSLFSKFENFLLISKQYSSLDFDQTIKNSSESKIILIEDLPNIYTSFYDISKENDFQSLILRYITSSRNKYPLVLIVTEVDFKGFDEMDTKETIIESEKTVQINFNPITKLSLQKIINRIVNIEYHSQKPDLELVESVITSSCGDIRSALNTLQFILGIIKKKSDTEFINHAPFQKNSKKPKLFKNQILFINSITSRETTLGLFHAIGKVVYNKRVGDSLEDRLENTLPQNSLPVHLKVYERRALKINPDDILDTIPVDYDTYVLALHHNYLDSCNDIEQVDFILSSLSYSDAMLSSKKMWQHSLQQRISSFVAISSILMGLPSPVNRSSTSKITYPVYQKILQKKNLKYYDLIDSIYENYYNDHYLSCNTMKSLSYLKKTYYQLIPLH